MSNDTTHEHSTENTTEHTGRTLEVDVGFYHVKLQGDPDDDIKDLIEAFEYAADRAKDDFEDLDQ